MMESWSSAEADEEWSDARRLSKEETLHLIEGRVLELLRSVKQGENPSMTLVRLGYSSHQSVHTSCRLCRLIAQIAIP